MQIFKKIISIIILIILITILFVSGTILIDSYLHPDEVPSFFGWKPFIVLSGSMETQISAGDIVVVKEIDTQNLKKGDIIAFKEDDVVITHRIDEVEEKDGQVQYITKGDNNKAQDISSVLPIIIIILLQTADSKKEKEELISKLNKQSEMEDEIEKLKKQNEELMKK